jgi:hypothetical protein
MSDTKIEEYKSKVKGIEKYDIFIPPYTAENSVLEESNTEAILNMTNLKAKLIRLENKKKPIMEGKDNPFINIPELNEIKPEEDLNLLFLKKCIDYINT